MVLDELVYNTEVYQAIKFKGILIFMSLKYCGWWLSTVQGISIWKICYLKFFFFFQLLKMFTVSGAGRIAADGFYIIMADNDDVMNQKMHANIRVSLCQTNTSLDWLQ